MADNQIISTMSNSNDSHKGTLTFSNDVIANVAGLAVQSVDGVTGVSQNLAEGLSGIINKNDAKKGIRISIDNNKVTISVGIIAKYGGLLNEIAKNVQTEVKNAVTKMTGAEVDAVNVTVAGLTLPQKEAQEPAPEQTEE